MPPKPDELRKIRSQYYDKNKSKLKPKSKLKTVIDKKIIKSKKFVVKDGAPEWQEICAVLSNDYKLDRLRILAQEFGIHPHESMKKRELCKEIALQVEVENECHHPYDLNENDFKYIPKDEVFKYIENGKKFCFSQSDFLNWIQNHKINPYTRAEISETALNQMRARWDPNGANAEQLLNNDDEEEYGVENDADADDDVYNESQLIHDIEQSINELNEINGNLLVIPPNVMDIIPILRDGHQPRRQYNLLKLLLRSEDPLFGLSWQNDPQEIAQLYMDYEFDHIETQTYQSCLKYVMPALIMVFQSNTHEEITQDEILQYENIIKSIFFNEGYSVRKMSPLLEIMYGGTPDDLEQFYSGIKRTFELVLN
jgi:hypothetical protein